MTGKVFHRPDEWHRPVNYVRDLEKAGLVVMPHQNLALMTCKTGPNQGPIGPMGPPGEPYYWDTIIASASDEYSPLAPDLVLPATHYRAPFPIELQYVRASLSIAPEGAPVIIDVHMNGTTIFSSPIQIDIGMKTSVGSVAPSVLAITSIPDDAEFTVYITQVGSTVAGAGAKVAATGKKVQPL